MGGWGTYLIPQFPTNDSVKDDRFPPVHRHAMFDVPTHSTGHNNLLKISSISHKIINRISVTDPDDILFDHGAFIQILRCIVGCCPIIFSPLS